MNRMTVQEVQQHLPQLLSNLRHGETLQIVLGDRVIGRLVADNEPQRSPRRPGSALGTLTIAADDQDHLQDFGDYMP